MSPELPYPASSTPPAWRQVVTVTGPASPDDVGITDAHNHVWIAPVEGAAAGSPVLDDYPAALQELEFYRQAGGGGLLDCQPYGCGRDGRVLARLAAASRVHIIGCTGFHRRKYYSPAEPLWGFSARQACDWFAGELLHGMQESLGPDEDQPVLAGFIKGAGEATLEDSALHLLEGAAQAARQTGAMVMVHTEKGAQAERLLDFFVRQGFSPHRLVLCHMDKRPDYGLHRELAEAGVLLEYDTFFRPQYDPERNLWPLLDQMVQGGFSGSVALATDLADHALWKSTAAGPGLASLPSIIQLRLRGLGYEAQAIRALLGGNILRRLARVR